MAKDNGQSKWQGASLSEMLDGELPVFLAHRPYQYANRLPEALTALGAAHGNALGIGAILRIPSFTAKTAKAFMSDISHLPLRIADPEIWRHPDAGWADAKALGANALACSYLKPPPAKVSAPWVTSVLDAQRNLGATVLLSANGWVAEANAAVSLRAAMDYVRESRRQVQDAPMWVNLTMDYRWLTDAFLRNTLIGEVLESNERDWYLRFWWPEVPTRYGQMLDQAVLDGYKTLAQELALEEKRLYLPNTGLTGWVSTALGAAGFSTGQAWPEQAFARQKVIAIKRNGPPPPAIPRIFDGTVLHTIEFDEFLRIRPFTDHKDFATSYLNEIDTSGHTPERAGLHYVSAAGDLTARLSKSRPNMAALRRARKGQRFVDSLPVVDRLTGINRPLHLPAWVRMLK